MVDRHLAHEEDDLEPLQRPYPERADWKAVEKRLRPRSPVVAGCFLAWIQDGSTDEGRTFLRSTIPPPVTFVLSRVGGLPYRRDVAPVWRS